MRIKSKYLLALIFVSTTSFLLFYNYIKGLNDQIVSFKFVEDLASYLSINPGQRSPLEFSKFCKWCEKEGKKQWKQSDLDERFQVYRLNETTHHQWKIAVKDKSLKELEDGLNSRFRSLMIPLQYGSQHGSDIPEDNR